MSRAGRSDLAGAKPSPKCLGIPKVRVPETLDVADHLRLLCGKLVLSLDPEAHPIVHGTTRAGAIAGAVLALLRLPQATSMT